MVRLFVQVECPEKRGLMLQVSTGEGKSLIIAMLAAVQQLSAQLEENGRKKFIAVVTCNQILAKRDADEMKPFFELFELTTDHICYDHNEEEERSADLSIVVICP
jgi:preprotein translocase subunit SecA